MTRDLAVLPPATELSRIPAVPWRDPHTVLPAELAGHIARLEDAVVAHPASANLRTCLGMAYAMNFEVYKSMDALEAATAIDPQSFWAQMKYAELHFRLRALRKAEEETLQAVELAETAWQLAIARRQLQETRRLLRDSARNVAWSKPLARPALVLSAMLALVFAAMWWR